MRKIAKRIAAAAAGESGIRLPRWATLLMTFQPLGSLAMGAASIVLWRRGFEFVPVITAFILAAFALMAFRVYHATIRSRDVNLGIKITDFSVQYLLSNMIIFVIPFYLESMTYLSRNMTFGIVLIGLFIIVSWNNLYFKILNAYPLLSGILFALIFFSTLNFVFPVLFGMRNIWSILVSALIAALSAGIYLFIHFGRAALPKVILGIAITVTLVWFGRSFIPPAPLSLKIATACAGVSRFAPLEPFSAYRGTAAFDIHFFNRIFAPRGLHEKIDHVWYLNGKKLFTVNLSEITGGTAEGFATWSYHRPFVKSGVYSVTVWTAGGQILGAKRFTYAVEGEEHAPAALHEK